MLRNLLLPQFLKQLTVSMLNLHNSLLFERLETQVGI